MKKQVLMIAHTGYRFDPRVRREAETLAADSQYTVTFLVPREHNRKTTYELDGVIVEELGISRYMGQNKARYLMSYFHFFLLAFLSCTKKFLKKEIDIIHVHNIPDFLVFAGIIPRLFGKKLILDVHDTMPETYSGKYETSGSKLLYKFLCLEERISCALAQKIIGVNHTQRDVLVNRGIPLEKTSVLLNVPDHKRFYQNNKMNKKTDQGPFRLVYHGVLEKRCGLDLLIKAIAKLADQIPGLQFHIVGRRKHEYSRSLLELAEHLNIADRIFCNFDGVPLDEVPEVLIKMDAGVVPNRKNEATELMLPIKMLEYISLGIPVAASRLKTIEYYFSEDMVSFFEPENIDSMADTISMMYKDQRKRQRQAMNAKVFLEKYGWEKHQLDLMRLYDHL
ncbi:glycosyltransferase family 4 protein [candidate division KSB1 bacterium]|nr:glycosyltransferase family 4 protein [candidate division KSB1 bacterium]NIR68888.1 glycosyltransferase family 4 protein [candidate division KSB1 bacterium]NIS22569.1 glycosyltransferase family 4 protein [candidate division KSB1 bacterium]NIT69414.1 glycosyltransferase family 4 protein [candidate division KSB1 bacterium]NIU23069.1 glycosyltransferase family 4 protein [candidate division KSB1 bacterium]